MYLSRVEIDREDRRKMKDLTHLEAYHAWVEDCFPRVENGEKRDRKLWRIDRLSNKDYLLLLSPEKPDPEKLERYAVEGSCQIKDYDGYLNSLKNGMKARFRVVLNPVKSIKDDEDREKRGRVVPCLSNEAQMKYLIDRSEKNGFKLNEEEFTITERGYGILSKKGQKRNIRLVRASYEGKLEIIDLDKFKEILINGLGKKKAYGFGLMTVIVEK